mmetsp:Transcript_6683/g.9717  ORF Transcript_6683/g.9717 Transcript_6683/m.9717 type:complete len:159 (-) Transcript_6683:1492-1968(-)
MVEIPGLLFEPYRCILKYLQETAPGTLPFAEILAPSPKDEDQAGVFHPPARLRGVDAPEYTYRRGFRYELGELFRPLQRLTFTPHRMDTEHRTSVCTELTDGCDLDDGQREALLNVLSQKVALVEGGFRKLLEGRCELTANLSTVLFLQDLPVPGRQS